MSLREKLHVMVVDDMSTSRGLILQALDAMGVTNVQGKNVPTANYEVLRVAGFPAVVEHHLTLGLGYALTETIRMDLGYLHAFAKSISQTSAGGFMKIESELSEDSYSFSLSFAF